MVARFVPVLAIVAVQLALAGVVYTYDSTGHLIQANYGTAGIVVYSYDAAGNLVSRLVEPPGTPPSAPVLTSPANGATGITTTPTLTWNTSSGATSYDVYFGSSSTPPMVTNISTASYAPGTLSAGTTYYWHIVARNSTGTADSGSPWSFTTLAAVSPPGVPVLISPPNGTSAISLTPTLSWNAASGAASYDVYFGAGGTPAFVTNTPATTYSPGTLVPGTTYSWKIVAKNAAGSASSAIWSFATLNGLPTPTGVSPASGGGLSQTFSFTFNDPDGYGDLKILDVLTSTFLDGEIACYLAFLPSSATAGTVYLVDDAGDAGGPFAGALLVNGSSSGSINNSQCTINASGSSVSASGNTLTLNLAMTFAPGWAGNKVFYMAARTATQNSGWEALGTWAVPGTPLVGPEVGTTTPAHSVTMGQTYSFSFTDTAGYADLFVLDVLTGSFLDGAGACYFAYVPTSATNGYLYLVDDAGDGGYAPGSPIALSSGATLQNSQCTLNTAGSSTSAGGNTLTLNLPIMFKPAFAGNQIFFEAARNNSTGNSGWQAAGSVTVP